MISLGKDDFKEWVKINSMFVAWNIRLFNYLIIIQTIIATLQKVAKIRYPKIRFCQCYDIFCVRLTKVHWVDVICHTHRKLVLVFFISKYIWMLVFLPKTCWVDRFWQHWVRLAEVPWGQGRRGEGGEGWKEGIPRSRGGRNPRKQSLQRAQLHVFSKEWKQHFVTIVTVTIYLTQVYIHFHLCNLCHPFTIVALGE